MTIGVVDYATAVMSSIEYVEDISWRVVVAVEYCSSLEGGIIWYPQSVFMCIVGIS